MHPPKNIVPQLCKQNQDESLINSYNAKSTDYVYRPEVIIYICPYLILWTIVQTVIYILFCIMFER